MTQEELYEMANKEGGVIKIYGTTTDANTAKKKMYPRRFPPKFEFETTAKIGPASCNFAEAGSFFDYLLISS